MKSNLQEKKNTHCFPSSIFLFQTFYKYKYKKINVLCAPHETVLEGIMYSVVYKGNHRFNAWLSERVDIIRS